MHDNIARHRRGTPRAARTCPYCSRSFRRNEHLARHVRIHTRERPFSCHCGASFTRQDLLSRHGRTMNHDPRDSLLDATSPEPPVTEQPSQQRQPPPRRQKGPAGDTYVADNEGGSSTLLYQGQSWSPPASDEFAGSYNSSLDAHIEPICATSIPNSVEAGNTIDTIGNDASVLAFDQFRDFGDFLGGLGEISTEWMTAGDFRDPGGASYQSNTFVPQPWATQVIPQQSPAGSTDVTSIWEGPSIKERLETTAGALVPNAPQEGRIFESATTDKGKPLTNPATDRISAEQYLDLCSSLEAFRAVISPEFHMPSQNALMRYVTVCFESYIRNMPFLHHSWRVAGSPMELFLAICAIGARGCFDCRVSRNLYKASKAIMLARILRFGGEQIGPATLNYVLSHNFVADDQIDAMRVASATTLSNVEWGKWEPIDTVATLILISGFASWEPGSDFVHDSLTLHRLQAQVLREIGLQEVEQAPSDDSAASAKTTTRPATTTSAWRDWIRHETARRVKLSAFAFVNVATIAYDVAPILRSSEVSLRLPCSTREWNALTLSQWSAARKAAPKEQSFLQDALRRLLANDTDVEGYGDGLDPWPTPLGNYILLHALTQRIHLVRELQFETARLPDEDAHKIFRALHRWALGFQNTSESSLEGNHGPIPFTCSAMLALAHIRLNQNYGPYRCLNTMDPAKIAVALCRCPPVQRSDRILSAVLYAVHALSVIIRVGHERVARSPNFFWTVRHTLSGLECALILSQWLAAIGRTLVETSLSDPEAHVLQWLKGIVKEAYSVADFDDGDYAFHETPSFLSIAVLKIWAHFFKKNAQARFINIIGEGLERYRLKCNDNT